MSFGMWGGVGDSHHVLDGGTDPPHGKGKFWGVKVSEQYCWNIVLSQQMLDAIKRVVGDNFVCQQDSVLVHLMFNTGQLPQCKTQLSFS